MKFLVGDSSNFAPDTIIQKLKVGGVRWQKLLRPHHVNVCVTSLLIILGGMGGR